MSAPADKPALRSRLRAARAIFPPVPLPVPSAFAHRLKPGLIVAGYLPVRNEADPAPFVQTAVAAGCDVALPHLTDRAAPLSFRRWRLDDPLVPGPFGPQPDAQTIELTPDIILTPLVGFDRQGHRLGQGGGHYDRAFLRYPDAWRIGLAWSVQEVPALIPDAWDIPLHAIATEQDWIVA